MARCEDFYTCDRHVVAECKECQRLRGKERSVGKYDGVKVRKPNRKKFPRVAVPKPTRIHKDKRKQDRDIVGELDDYIDNVVDPRGN
jgi:hypothetical protein